MVLLDARRVHGAGNIDKTMLEKCKIAKMHPWVLRSVAKTMCNLQKETPELALPIAICPGLHRWRSKIQRRSPQKLLPAGTCKHIFCMSILSMSDDVSNAKRIGMVLEHQCSIDLRPSHAIKTYQEISNQNIKTLTGTG